jgi:hypothetical protein
MALTPRLEVRQAQSLTLTPQLMQSIRLLQLSHLELSAFVETELLRNPLLEREENSEGNDTDSAEIAERPPELSAYEDTVEHNDRIQTADSIADGFDTAVENVFPEQGAQDFLTQSSDHWSEGTGGANGEAPDIDQFVAARPSLSDHLETQVNFILRDPVEMALEIMQVKHVRGRIFELRIRKLFLAPIGRLLLLGKIDAEQFAHDILQPRPIGIGPHEARGDLGAIDGASDDAEAVAQHGDIKAGIVEDLGDIGVAQQPAEIGRFLEVGWDLHDIGAAIPWRKLHDTKAIAMRVQPHGFGIDRHFAAIAREVGQIALVQPDRHDG